MKLVLEHAIIYYEVPTSATRVHKVKFHVTNVASEVDVSNSSIVRRS